VAYFPLNVRQDALPIQMLSIKEKDSEWRKANLDALESIGRKQFLENINILENYRIVNNEMLYNHYVFTDSVTDLAQMAVKEFDLPPYLRHYDITRKVINVLSGEFQKRPDIFRVAAIDEFSENEYLRQKGDLLKQTVIGQIQQRIQQQLLQEGLDPNRQDFASQEEQQAYQEQVQEETKKLTPPEIEDYMREKYRAVPEKWGEMVINLDKQRFNTPEMEMQEFEDMLISDRAYRHFYLKANGLGYGQETWNPIRVFFHKSPDVKYVEDGDYVGRVFYLSITEIINRYGHKMPKKQLENLYGDYLKKKKFGGAEYAFFQAANVPFENYPEYARTLQAFGYDPHTGVPFTGSFGNFTSQDVDVLFNSSSTTYNLQGLTQATEAYWRSQKKVGFLIMQDPETGELIEELVGEDFIIPDFVQEVDDDPSYEDFVFSPQKKINTIRWTWVNEVWGGIKVNAVTSETPGGVYIDIKPIPFQFKGDSNPYEVKLPVCGAIFNNRNAKSMSLVDMMKPYQILYNIFMNRIYQLATTEVGKFLLLDPRMIPNDKDWGGEKNLEKWRIATREYKIGQIDTSPGARGGSNFNQFTEVDLREFDNIKASVEIARMIEEQAMFQVGITQQRLGIVQASESATGVQQSVQNSYAQTESYFTKFGNYKKRVLQMNLDIAQFCSATNRDMTLSLIQDDMSRQFIQMNGTELLNSQLGIRIFNSQELLRQNEMMKQLIMKNNTTNSSMAALAQAIYTESPAKLISILKKMEADLRADTQAQRDHEQQMLQAELDAEQQKIDSQNAWQAEQNRLDRENRIQEKVISVANFDPDVAGNNEIDVVGMGKLAIEEQRLEADKSALRQANINNTLEQASKYALEKDKLASDKRIKESEKRLKERELASKQKLLNEQGKQAALENKTQLQLSKEKHERDLQVQKEKLKGELELKNKDIELKNLELRNAKEMANLKKQEVKQGIKVDQKLGDAKVKTESALGNAKVKTEEGLGKAKVDIAKGVVKSEIETKKAINKLKVHTAKKAAEQKVKEIKNPKPPKKSS
jgi:hypothetical protein